MPENCNKRPAETCAESTKKSQKIVDESRPTLYSYWRSSCSYRVRIAMAVKGIDYEYRSIHLVKDGGEQKKAEYAAINPKKEVPTLVLPDGTKLTQSTAIIEYLEEAYPYLPKLLPADPLKRAKVRELCQVVGSGIQPVQNLSVLKTVMELTEGEADAKTAAKMKWGKDVISNGFDALETLMAQSAGQYSVGDDVTIADAFLVPQVYNAVRFSVDMEAYPTIQRVHAALMQLPAVKAAEPSAQPDAQ